jgi:hypothetical protein
MTSGGITAVLLTSILAIKNRSRDRISVPASAGGIPRLHDFLGEVATRAGWDKPAVERLLLAGEEAALFLIDRRTTAGRRKESAMRVSARSSGATIEVELVSGPGAENIESLVDDLKGDSASSVEEAGLRILRHLVRDVRHLQFNQGDVLQITVESTPLE